MEDAPSRRGRRGRDEPLPPSDPPAPRRTRARGARRVPDLPASDAALLPPRRRAVPARDRPRDVRAALRLPPDAACGRPRGRSRRPRSRCSARPASSGSRRTRTSSSSRSPAGQPRFGEGDTRAHGLPPVAALAASRRPSSSSATGSSRTGSASRTRRGTPADAAADFVARLLSIRDAAPEAEDSSSRSSSTARTRGRRTRRTARRSSARSRPRSPRDGLRGRDAVRGARATVEPRPLLERLVAGSWVDGNLATWIGAPAKNRAWDLLRDRARGARRTRSRPRPCALARRGPAGRRAARRRAKAALFAAEASDWFWWFGDDHSSAHDAVFDALFRGHLVTAYRALGRQVPAELEHPIERRIAAPPVLPTEPISPRIDGASCGLLRVARRGATTRRGRRGRWSGASARFERSSSAATRPGPASSSACTRPSPPASASLADRTLRVLFAGPDGETRETHDLPLKEGVSGADGCRVGVARLVEIACRGRRDRGRRRRLPRPPPRRRRARAGSGSRRRLDPVRDRHRRLERVRDDAHGPPERRSRPRSSARSASSRARSTGSPGPPTRASTASSRRPSSTRGASTRSAASSPSRAQHGVPLDLPGGRHEPLGPGGHRRHPRRGGARLPRPRRSRTSGRRVRAAAGRRSARTRTRALRPCGGRSGPTRPPSRPARWAASSSNNSSGMCCGVAQNAYHTLESLTFVLPSGTAIDTARPDADEALPRRRSRRSGRGSST